MNMREADLLPTCKCVKNLAGQTFKKWSDFLEKDLKPELPSSKHISRIQGKVEAGNVSLFVIGLLCCSNLTSYKELNNHIYLFIRKRSSFSARFLVKHCPKGKKTSICSWEKETLHMRNLTYYALKGHISSCLVIYKLKYIFKWLNIPHTQVW